MKVEGEQSELIYGAMPKTELCALYGTYVKGVVHPTGQQLLMVSVGYVAQLDQYVNSLPHPVEMAGGVCSLAGQRVILDVESLIIKVTDQFGSGANKPAL